jgi:hypothetical protein
MNVDAIIEEEFEKIEENQEKEAVSSSPEETAASDLNGIQPKV